MKLYFLFQIIYYYVLIFFTALYSSLLVFRLHTAKDSLIRLYKMAPPKKEVKVEKNLRTCIVPFCPTRAVTGLSRLPKDAVMKQKWLEILQIKFDTKLTPNSRVCHRHFGENSFTNSKIRKKLKPTAEPTENLPKQIPLLTYKRDLCLAKPTKNLADSDSVPIKIMPHKSKNSPINTNELPEKNVLASKETKSDSAEIVVIANRDTYSITATKKPEITSSLKTASTPNAKNCTNLVGLISSCETEDNETLDQEQNEQEFNIDLDLEVTQELDEMKYSQTSINIANMSRSAKEIYQTSLGISNSVVNKEKETKYCDINNQEAIFQSIKVEHQTIQQSQMSESADPLLIDKIKEEKCKENEATPIQVYSEVYIKLGEFGASDYQNEKENGMVDLEIKEELVNPFVEYEKNQESNH